MALTPASHRKLISRLPLGYKDKVAAELEFAFTPEYVRLVAHGTRNNDTIMAALIALAEKTEQLKKSAEERIANL